MKRYIFPLVLIFVTNMLSSQNQQRIIIDIPTDQKPWNNINWNNDSDWFQFAIVSDRTGAHRPGIFSKGISKLNLLQPEFVMSVGDLIEGYTEDTAVLDHEWTEFMGFIEELEVPFFYVPGNHDITNKVMEDKWKQLFGVTYYHFVYNDVLFLCLNSEDNYRGAGKGTIDDAQFNYIKNTLDDHQNVKWTLVFMHQPLWIQEDTKRWQEVEELLNNRPHNVFAGHYHRYWKTERNNGKYIALATTGGGSRLRGTRYGEFDHVVWVTMTDDGPLLANLMLEGVWDEDVVTDNLVDLVRNKPFPVEIRPVYIDDPRIEKVNAEVRITNDSDYPMHVALEGMVHKDLLYELEKNQIEIDPNDVATIAIEVANFRHLNFSKVDPITIEAEITYDYLDQTEVVFSNTVRFIPLYKHKVRPTPSKIKVDGDLSEWKEEWIVASNYDGRPFDYNGEEDCSLRFKTTYDQKNLYIAIEVVDDEIFKKKEVRPWKQDVVILALDARPAEVSAYNIGNGRDWLTIMMGYHENEVVFQPSNLPAGSECKMNQQEDKADIELSIPMEYLDKMQKKPWTSFRLGIGYYDFDEEGTSRTVHYWYPAWNSAKTFNGSGMFFKE